MSRSPCPRHPSRSSPLRRRGFAGCFGDHRQWCDGHRQSEVHRQQCGRDHGNDQTQGRFRQSSTALWPGQFVNVRAKLEIEHGRVLIPSRTIQTGPQGKYVWVVNPDSTAVMKKVDVLRNYTPPGKPEEAVISSGTRSRTAGGLGRPITSGAGSSCAASFPGEPELIPALRQA